MWAPNEQQADEPIHSGHRSEARKKTYEWKNSLTQNSAELMMIMISLIEKPFFVLPGMLGCPVGYIMLNMKKMKEILAAALLSRFFFSLVFLATR